ncbi:NAD(P)/FAD-dependent oxidoreductase [Massiliimalia timonensis]|uniref:NAD(P)/FAD-dependent oxidoreductase n=1 Tax=Massiliimalia timonensis TaxID=1987501 RepID=UPI000B8B1E53|nr:NAD(P)/FAD-dependent oxidoreductase [Massiliimalia timonensis]MBS7174882.1 NAD(P)/FAD-dependent oxidoreductase [Clostridiales bacterium]
MANIIIIGAGPAGVSAALYTARAGIQTTILTNGKGALQKTEKIENYYGFAQPISGPELEQVGLAGAVRLGVEVKQTEVLGITFEEKLVVQTTSGNFPADSVLLATGSSRTTPRIPGIRELEGHGVSYCAVCDAFFYRGKSVAVLGNSDYALHEALELLPVAGSVTLLTDGLPPSVEVPEQIQTDLRKIAAIRGTEQVEAVEFSEGDPLLADGIFVAYGVAGSTDLAKKIGAVTDGNRIVVDERMATNIPGLYAAGDCTGGLLQISKAVYEGAKAGTEMIQYIRKLK